MTSGVVPVVKSLFLCDNILEDRTNGKIHVIGAFNSIRPPDESGFPIRYPRICVFAQFSGGLQRARVLLEVVSARTGRVLYRSREQPLSFDNRLALVNASFRLEECRFPEAGVSIFELYCNNVFIDDRPLPVQE
jgi:hypothetical protein